MASPQPPGQPRTFNPANVPAPPPTYNQVATTPLAPTSELITLAGQVGIDPQTRHIPGDFVSQARIACRNVQACLAAAGATPRDIVHVRHYIVHKTGNADLDALEIFDRGWGPVWMEFMDREADGHRPPDTVLGVAALAGKSLLYEVEVWAIRHARAK